MYLGVGPGWLVGHAVAWVRWPSAPRSSYPEGHPSAVEAGWMSCCCSVLEHVVDFDAVSRCGSFATEKLMEATGCGRVTWLRTCSGELVPLSSIYNRRAYHISAGWFGICDHP